jgi:hypothetical protein
MVDFEELSISSYTLDREVSVGERVSEFISWFQVILTASEG